jgi:hypothetical protein
LFPSIKTTVLGYVNFLDLRERLALFWEVYNTISISNYITKAP